LLLALDELIKVQKISVSLVVAHLDHGLRETSKDDANWLKEMVRQLDYPFVTRRIDIKKRAASTGDNLEQAARRARYDFLRRVAGKAEAQVVLTAHTLDDQAETVLLRLLRGSAAEGLSGMEVVRPIAAKSTVKLARPLISWARRRDVEDYCRVRSIAFRSDEMNEDERFSRVRVRRQLLPLMQSFNNKIVDALSRTATMLREDTDVLTIEAEKLLGEATAKKTENDVRPGSLNVRVLGQAPASLRRRALRLWLGKQRGHLRRVEMVHLVTIDRLLQGTRGGRIAELPEGGTVTRKQGWLELNLKPKQRPS
jgi:tRNA(Ile)-lysidine synthase